MPRAKDKLCKVSDHLFYEIWMFKSLVQKITSGVADDRVINNALLESFGIHLRVLIWFFYPDKRRKKEDDVFAEDFFSPPKDWQTERPPITPVLQRAKVRVHKEIAHLTYKRLFVTPETKPWELRPIFDDMNEVIEKFLSMVPEDLLGERRNEFKKLRKTNRMSGG